MLNKLWSVSLLSLLLLNMSSCSPFASKKPPVILIMVEGLSEKDFLCGDSRLTEGLDALEASCSDFIRFTHSFSPSIMTQASVATLLSGVSATAHGVMTNGPSALASRYETLAEKALRTEMRTAIFSGGIPLLPKFGIRQGYESYNDSFSEKGRPSTRSFEQSIERSLKWIDDEVGGSSFFLTYYVPDLLYSAKLTTDNFGEERPASRGSQLTEVYESVDLLVRSLQKRKRWKNSHIIFVGLKGESTSSLPSQSLKPQLFHVPLQIKTAGGVKTNLKEFEKELVPFTQLSRWIGRMALHKPSQGAIKFEKRKSKALTPQFSHWHQWLGLSNWPAMGLRRKGHFFQLSPELLVYNSLEDKMESHPLPEKEGGPLLSEYQVLRSAIEMLPAACYLNKLSPGQAADRRKNCKTWKTDDVALDGLSQIIHWHEQGKTTAYSDPVAVPDLVSQNWRRKSEMLQGWLAFKALYGKNWPSLFELGRLAKNSRWRLVARLNLREPVRQPRNGCLKFFVGETKNIEDFYKTCRDTELRRVVEGLSKLKKKQKPSQNFWDQVFKIRRRRMAMNANVELQFMNDVSSAFSFHPSLAELYFFLPEHNAFLDLIEADKP